MWLAPVAAFLVLTATENGTPADPSQPSTAVGATIATRQTLFAIPFRVQSGSQAASGPAEIQLLVSADHGSHWHLYAKAKPSDQYFMFRAAGDGEYWFSMRTRDEAGRMRPERKPTPGLRVIVDTTPPKLHLQARRGAAGEITARWDILEHNVKPDSLALQYRIGPNAAWQPIAISREQGRTSERSSIGSVTWLPPAEAQQIDIRAEMVDQAGNPTVVHTQVAPGGPSQMAQQQDQPAANPPPPAQPQRLPPQVSSQQAGPHSSAPHQSAAPSSAWHGAPPAAAPIVWPVNGEKQPGPPR